MDEVTVKAEACAPTEVRPLDAIDFTQFVRASSDAVRAETQALWWHLYRWVVEHGYADTGDQAGFVEYVQAFRNIEANSINRHLRRMAAAGLLKRHRLGRKLDATTRQVLGLGSGIFDALTRHSLVRELPSVVVRYTLPGCRPPLHMAKAGRAFDQVEKGWARDRATYGGIPLKQHLLLVHEPGSEARLVAPSSDVAEALKQLYEDSPSAVVYVIEAASLPTPAAAKVWSGEAYRSVTSSSPKASGDA